MSDIERFLFTFFNAGVAAKYGPLILEGMLLTTLLGLAVIAAGLILGLSLASVRSFRLKPLNFFIVCYADILRALPPLVIIIIFFFAFPYLGLSMSSFVATWLSLTLVLAAFSEEIFWAGIMAVPKGQTEAARSTGMSRFQTLCWVVLPQALRITIAPLTNRMIGITKGTALGSVVALHEILNRASSGASEAGNPTPLTLGALAYLVLFIPFVAFGRWIEARYKWKR